MYEIIATRRGVWDLKISLYGRRHISGHTEIIKPVLLERLDNNFADMDPFLEFDYENAQALMDSLWDCGLRPSEGSGSAGSLLATQNHLKDMQELTRRLLGMVEKHDTK